VKPIAVISVGLLLTGLSCVAAAQSYPAKPILILVPTPPGGGNDIMARMAAQTWWGILAPRGTPVPTVAQLNEVISNAIRAGEVRSRIAALGAQPAGGPPQQLAALIRDELPKWSRVIKEAGIRLD